MQVQERKQQESPTIQNFGHDSYQGKKILAPGLAQEQAQHI